MLDTAAGRGIVSNHGAVPRNKQTRRNKMKFTFLPDNNTLAYTLDHIFTPDETKGDEFKIRRSKIKTKDDSEIRVIMVHSNEHSENGWFMAVYKETPEGRYTHIMGYMHLPSGLKQAVEEHYGIKFGN